MKTVKTIFMLALGSSLAVWAAQTTLAQPLGLTITYPVVGVTNLLWDLTALTNPLQNVDLKLHTVSNGETNTEVEVFYAGAYAQDGRGKLAGSGTNTATIFTSDDQGGVTYVNFDGKYSAKGNVTGAKGVAKVTFATRVSGTAPLEGKDRAVAASALFTVKLDAVKDQVSGRQLEHASASGLGSLSEARDISDTFLSNPDLRSQLGDGTWTLMLNFDAPNGNKLSGRATVTLSSGTVYQFAFVGLASPRTHQSKLVLKGQESARGSILQVTLDSENTIMRIVGLVSGQLVNIK